MRMRLAGAAFAAAMACACANGADAATITRSYTFDADQFIDVSGPFQEISGTFTVTFDPSVSTNPIALDSFTSNLGVGYSAPTFGAYSGSAAIGNDCGPGYCQIVGGQNEFYFAFSYDQFGNVLGGRNFGYSAENYAHIDFSPVTVVSAVPLPASAPLFGAALLGLGALGTRMQRRSHPQTA